MIKSKTGSDLVFFLLERGFGFLQSGLELFLLLFQATALFVDLVDVAATFADLVHQVLDLIGQVLVLATSAFQVFLALVVGGLETEELGRVVAAFLLGGVQLGGKIVHLGLPFGNDLVEVLAALLHLVGQELSAFNFDLHVLELSAEALLDLFEGNVLLVQRLDGLLSLA